MDSPQCDLKELEREFDIAELKAVTEEGDWRLRFVSTVLRLFKPLVIGICMGLELASLC